MLGAKRLKTNEPVNYVEYARKLIDKSEFNEAIEFIKDNIENLSGQDLVLLGTVLKRRERIDQAKECYAFAMKKNPIDKEAIYKYVTLGFGEVLDSEAEDEQIHEFIMKNVDLLSLEQLIKFGNKITKFYEEEVSLICLEKALEINPHNVDVLKIYFVRLANLNRFEGAIELIEGNNAILDRGVFWNPLLEVIREAGISKDHPKVKLSLKAMCLLNTADQYAYHDINNIIPATDILKIIKEIIIPIMAAEKKPWNKEYVMAKADGEGLAPAP